MCYLVQKLGLLWLRTEGALGQSSRKPSIVDTVEQCWATQWLFKQRVDEQKGRIQTATMANHCFSTNNLQLHGKLTILDFRNEHKNTRCGFLPQAQPQGRDMALLSSRAVFYRIGEHNQKVTGPTVQCQMLQFGIVLWSSGILECCCYC